MSVEQDQQSEQALEEIVQTGYRRTSPQNLISIVNSPNNYGLARASKFYVKFGVPDGLLNREEEARSLSYFCDAAELPGRLLDVSDMRIYGPSFKVPTKSTYNEVTFTLLCDSFLNQKKFFDDWIEFINPSDSYDFAYRDEYISRIELTQMSDLNAETKIYTFHDAFPINVAPIPTNWAEDGFHRLQVTFTYYKWDDIDERGNVFKPGELASEFPNGLGYDPLSRVRELQEQRNAYLNIVQGRTPLTEAERQQIESGAEGIPISG